MHLTRLRPQPTGSCAATAGRCAADERAFALWYAEPAHREALARLEAVWNLLDDDGDAVAGQPEPTHAVSRQRTARSPARVYGSHPKPRPQRRALAVGGVAAALALAVLGGVQDWPLRLRAAT